MSKQITLTESEQAEWDAAEGIAQGPSGIRARLIERAKALGEREGQATVRVYAAAGHRAIVTVSRADDGSWGQVATTTTPALSPFQRAIVERATRHVARDAADGRAGAACLESVLGQIAYPARAERDAARAIVQAAYPGVSLDSRTRPGDTLRGPTGEYLGRA